MCGLGRNQINQSMVRKAAEMSRSKLSGIEKKVINDTTEISSALRRSNKPPRELIDARLVHAGTNSVAYRIRWDRKRGRTGHR